MPWRRRVLLHALTQGVAAPRREAVGCCFGKWRSTCFAPRGEARHRSGKGILEIGLAVAGGATSRDPDRPAAFGWLGGLSGGWPGEGVDRVAVSYTHLTLATSDLV